MAQETDVQLKAEATIIKNETVSGANTANRIGTHLENIADSKANKTEIPDITGKVDKVTGYGLSQENFTTVLKTKLDNISGTNTGDETASTIVTKIGDGNKISSTYLPSYVDDVIEVYVVGLTPLASDWFSLTNGGSALTPETGKLYTVISAGIYVNKEYRWSGSAYVNIAASPGSTDEVTEGATNLYFTNSRVWNLVLTGLSLVTNSAITAADSILVAFGKLQAQITSLGSTKADKSLIAQTFSGEFNLSTGGEVSYKIYSSNTALTPTVAASPVENSFARIVIDAGASASLVTTNMGTPRVGSDTFTVSKKNEIMMTCLPDGTDGSLVLYYSIKVLN